MRRMGWQALLGLGALAANAWSGALGGEAGATILGDRLFWVIRLAPELEVGAFGAGLDIELLMQRGGVRDDDWASSHQWVRLIRFVRFGDVGDRVHIRLGALEGLTLGHGFLVRRYTNWYDEDFRRLGVHACVRAQRLGGEAFASSIGRAETLGARVWAEPFSRLKPAFRPWRLGFTLVADCDPDARRTTSDGLAVVGFDTELPIVHGVPAGLFLFGEAASIVGYGKGAMAGIGIELGSVAVAEGLQCRLELRSLGERFLPDYFDAFYGVDRFDPTTGRGKKDLLDGRAAQGGWYAQLRGNLGGSATLVGGFSRRNGITGSGALHLEIGPLSVGRLLLRGSLDATGIEKLGDLTHSGHSLLELWAGCRLNGWASCSLRFRRTFERTDDKAYRPVDMVMPRVAAAGVF